VAAENAYNERAARVENQIIAWLRLGTARNTNEMFWVFSKFNVLFVQPKVRYLEARYWGTVIDIYISDS
jgi:dynein heavy chain 1